MDIYVNLLHWIGGIYHVVFHIEFFYEITYLNVNKYQLMSSVVTKYLVEIFLYGTLSWWHILKPPKKMKFIKNFT